MITKRIIPCLDVRDGQVVGYDMELAALFCQAAGYGLEIVDMNFDGIINAVDLSLLKRGLMNGFTGSKEEHAADFNMDGKKDIADVRSMVLFLTTQA